VTGTAYSGAVRARCRDPRRAGGWPDGTPGVGTGERGSLDAGAWTRVQVHVADGSNVIDDARFRVFGCSAALASASWAADALVGRSLDEARALGAAAIAAALDLPADKVAMAALAAEAASEAVRDWERRMGAGDWGLGPGATAVGAPGQDSQATR